MNYKKKYLLLLHTCGTKVLDFKNKMSVIILKTNFGSRHRTKHFKIFFKWKITSDMWL